MASLPRSATATTYIDGLEIDRLRTAPFPNMSTRTAELEFFIIPESEGQRLIDSSYYGNNEPHEYTVMIDQILTWAYSAKILDYKIVLIPLKVVCTLKLVGDFKYEREGIPDTLEVCRTFSE
jgi:hypothetical protein